MNPILLLNYFETIKQRLNECDTDLVYQLIQVESATRFESLLLLANEEELEIFYSDINGGKTYPKQFLICVMKKHVVDALCKHTISPSSPSALVDTLANSQFSADDSAHILQLYSSNQQTRQSTLAAMRNAFGTQILTSRVDHCHSGIKWRVAVVAQEVIQTAKQHPIIEIKAMF